MFDVPDIYINKFKIKKLPKISLFVTKLNKKTLIFVKKILFWGNFRI